MQCVRVGETLFHTLVGSLSSLIQTLETKAVGCLAVRNLHTGGEAFDEMMKSLVAMEKYLACKRHPGSTPLCHLALQDGGESKVFDGSSGSPRPIWVEVVKRQVEGPGLRRRGAGSLRRDRRTGKPSWDHRYQS